MATKYGAFASYLMSLPGNQSQHSMTFGQIEDLTGGLAAYARRGREWWANNSSNQAQAWVGAGWYVENVNFETTSVTFRWGVSRAQCRFVGDVKYKRVNAAGIKHPDLYQLLSYVVGTGLPSGTLVYAAGEGQPAAHEVHMLGRTLHVRTLALAGDIPEVMQEVAELAAFVRAQASSPSLQVPAQQDRRANTCS